MEDIKTEKWTLEDGRRAERRVTDSSTTESVGESKRIIELHVEDERPLHLRQRVVEKRKPFVYERETQTVDRQGNVVEKKVESIDPRVQMQLIDHTRMQETDPTNIPEPDDCNCITKEEMIDTIVTAVKALKNEIISSQAPPTSAPTVSPPPPAPGSLADEIAKRISSDTSTTTLTDKIMWGIIIALIIGLGYVIFIGI